MYLYSDEVQESSENRERRHAAASVLGDSELLMFHAVANNEVSFSNSSLSFFRLENHYLSNQ